MSQEELSELKKKFPTLFSIFKIIEKSGPISSFEIAEKRYGTGSDRYKKCARGRTLKNVSRLMKKGVPIVRLSRNGAIGIYEVRR